jgi:hypothetical protein
VSLASLAKAQEPTAEAKSAEPGNILAGLEERYQQLAEQLKQEPPKREIKVQVVGAQKTRFLRIDPKLLENKFVAKFELVCSETAAPEGPSSSNAHTTANRALQKFQDPIVIQLKALVQQCPAEHRPNQRMIDFLTSDDCGRDVPYSVMVRGYSRFNLSFQVFAPTAEDAEHRARAIIQLYDVGFCRPLQQSLLGEGQKVLEQLRSQNAELGQLSATIRAEEKLAKQSEISGDIFSQLKAQKVMVAIELAGLSARVKACDAMLTDPKKLEASTLQSVSDMKVRAEIERVGMKEKLDQINLFIAEGEAQTAANFRRSVLGSKAGGLRNGIRSNEQVATRYAELVALYGPFQIPENKITVGPIEWTQE